MDLALPPFESDLSRASTLPSRLYTDPAVLEVEREKIFARTWQPVASLSDLQKPGDFVTAEVAGEPIVVLKDEQGTLRAFFNVCRHRAGPVAEGKGCKKALTCRYHGWTYALSGNLIKTREWDGVQDFDAAAYSLPKLRVDTFGPFVFVNLADDGPTLAEVLGEIASETQSMDFAGMTRVASRTYNVQCNWKTYVDNYLEGYHVPMVHPGLFKELDYDAYRVETRRYHSTQYAPIRPAPAGAARQYDGTGEDDRALYYWVFPNWMLNIYPDNMSINIVVPTGPGTCDTIFEWYFRDPNAESTKARLPQTIAFSDEIQLEDIYICEAVQKRLGSRSYDRGRYSVARENGVHHFHGLVHAFLSA